jgi:uncharacterized protein
MRRQLATLAIALLLAGFSEAATARDAVVPREERVPMHDAVELAADLYLPAGAGPFPTILVRTPYGKGGMRIIAEKFVRSGYAVLVQDVRGKYASNGDFLPFVNEKLDGLATLDWIAASEWSDGRTGIWGSSYLAMSGLLLATEDHPALRAVFSASGWVGGSEINESGGAFHMGLAIPWLLFEGGKTQRSLKHFDLDELFLHKPLRDVFSIAGVEMPAWLDESVPRANDDPPTARASVPVFHMAGWYDFVSPGSLATWRAMSAGSDAPQKLMVGPWIHDQFWGEESRIGEIDAGPASIMGLDRVVAIAIDWFDLHVRGEARPDPSFVNVFVIGDNRWRSFESWPPREATSRSFYLTSGGSAGRTPDDGRLLAARPRLGQAAKDSFLFDPDRPVPTLGGANFHFFPNTGVREQSEIEQRDDVLVYTTAPLERDVVLAGPIHAVLHVSTEGRDTDFTAKLVDVTPEGSAFNIADGIVRLSRSGGGSSRVAIEPGRIYEITIELGEIAMRIPAGHRLRLDLTSSNFPKFDRNPNTGEDSFAATEFRAVRQTVYHSRRHPSRVTITILEGGQR